MVTYAWNSGWACFSDFKVDHLGAYTLHKWHRKTLLSSVAARYPVVENSLRVFSIKFLAVLLIFSPCAVSTSSFTSSCINDLPISLFILIMGESALERVIDFVFCCFGMIVILGHDIEGIYKSIWFCCTCSRPGRTVNHSCDTVSYCLKVGTVSAKCSLELIAPRK